MLKKLLVAATAIGLVAVPTVASANPVYNSWGSSHSRSYGYVGGYYSPGYGGYYGAPYGGYGAYANPYSGYNGNPYGYRYNRHRNNNGVAGALVGGVIGAVIGSAISGGGHRY